MTGLIVTEPCPGPADPPQIEENESAARAGRFAARCPPGIGREIIST
jgi:hypothetical protein